ncbi:hypothetical protein [Caballeronia sp. ATUFL_M2_KS44]|uniref:hypothetical protein n=1 Tax=Caballeronia sp. ATUFL_M2_KS44 TaxID=2921767 RepID=UPI0020297312|nr:hypothetical protein [Caballeronia sp. ATUFL_M2_KS44]
MGVISAQVFANVPASSKANQAIAPTKKLKSRHSPAFSFARAASASISDTAQTPFEHTHRTIDAAPHPAGR